MLKINNFLKTIGNGIANSFWNDIPLRNWIITLLLIEFLLFPPISILVKMYKLESTSANVLELILKIGLLAIAFVIFHRKDHMEKYFKCDHCRCRRIKLKEDNKIETKVFQDAAHTEMYSALFVKHLCNKCYYKECGNSVDFIMD
ncbi:hypothetical protein N9948_01665 [bacterium]|nr:hypothetical protein [bacterium]